MLMGIFCGSILKLIEILMIKGSIETLSEILIIKGSIETLFVEELSLRFKKRPLLP